MLKKRIIPCLDIQGNRAVKGINFKDVKDAGDPLKLAQKYVAEGADELVFLDITATIEERKTLLDLVQKLAREINIPFTVGGGVSSVEDAALLIASGADKVSINSAAVKRPELISELALRFGSQCVVLAIDTKFIAPDWKVVIHGGKTITSLNTIEWALEAQRLGAGEILLTSMNNDGTKNGFALDIIKEVGATVNIPIIASGGAGKISDFTDLFTRTAASAGLAASIFHYGEVAIPNLKSSLKNQYIPIR